MTTAIFYKVIVLNIDIFCTTIVNEKHFGTRSEAEAYVADMVKIGYYALVVDME